MIKNKIFALVFRSAAAVLTIVSILSTSGAFAGNFSWNIFLYYTMQSNVLVLALFVYLIIATIKSIVKDGKEGGACFSPRLCACVLICILLTFAVFWVMLAPRFENFAELIKFSNTGVHLLVPMLLLADYIMFSVGGKLTRRDPYWFTIVPIAYLIFATIAGFSGVMFHGAHFPYFFIDYYETGWMCAFYIVAISVIYLAVAFLMYFIDTKRKKIGGSDRI